MASDFKILNLQEKIKNDNEQFDKQLKQRHAAYHELYKSCMTLTEDLKSEREKSAAFKIKADKYDAAIEKERARGREKYQRLYKGSNRIRVMRFAKKHLGKNCKIIDGIWFDGVDSGIIAGYSYNFIIIGAKKGWKEKSECDTILKEFKHYIYADINSIKITK